MLKSERIILRLMLQEDVARQHEFNQDVELYGLMNRYPSVSTLEMAQTFFEMRNKADNNIAPFAIEAERKYIGHCSLSGIEDRHGNARLEILIGDRDYWGKGCGREAVRLLLDYAFRQLGLRRIELTTHVKNLRALRCFEACGFIEECRPRKEFWFDGAYIDMVKMSILCDEWQMGRA